MRIHADKLKSVVFLVQDGIPRATGFLVGLPQEASGHNIGFVYVVTARHCIEGTQGRPFNIRVDIGKDRFEEIPTVASDWYIHDSADVAVALWEGVSSSGADLKVEGIQFFISADHTYPVDKITSGVGAGVRMAGEVQQGEIHPRDVAAVEVGHEVMFVSLLQGQAGKQSNLPIARFGHVSRLPKEPVMIPSGGSLASIDAYLVECHSWGGHSGSPCYWLHPWNQLIELPDPRAGKEGEKFFVPYEQHTIALLGLVSGHWDIKQRAETTGDVVGEIRTALNSGIAIITPAEAIRELLMREDVVEERIPKAQEVLRQAQEAGAITPDFAADDGGELTQTDFDDALRRATRIIPPGESAPEG